MTNTVTDRLPSLDGLRGVSILLVLLGHIATHRAFDTVLAAQSRFWQGIAYFGVTVFFVISGFLITHLLLREYALHGFIDWLGFFRRRAFRILPASMIFIAVVAFMGHPSAIQTVYALTWSTSYFFDQAYIGLQHLWSLSVEEQFYLLWPIVFLLGPRQAKRYCWAVMLISPMVRVLLIHNGYVAYREFFPAITDCIAAGCLLAFYEARVRAFVIRTRLVSNSGFFLLCVLAISAGYLSFRYRLILMGAASILIAAVISAAIARRDALLNSRPLVLIGLVSYSLYLWQQVFLVCNGPVNFLPLRVVAAFVCAYLSHMYIEIPAQRFGKQRSKPSLSAAEIH